MSTGLLVKIRYLYIIVFNSQRNLWWFQLHWVLFFTQSALNYSAQSLIDVSKTLPSQLVNIYHNIFSLQKNVMFIFWLLLRNVRLIIFYCISFCFNQVFFNLFLLFFGFFFCTAFCIHRRQKVFFPIMLGYTSAYL